MLQALSTPRRLRADPEHRRIQAELAANPRWVELQKEIASDSAARREQAKADAAPASPFAPPAAVPHAAPDAAPEQPEPYTSHEQVDQAKPISCNPDQPPVTDQEIDAALRAKPAVLARLAVTPESITFSFSLRVVQRAKIVATTLAAAAAAARAAAVDAPATAPAPPTPACEQASRKLRRDADKIMAEAEGADLPWWKRGKGKWGAYLAHHRFNTDQAATPLPCAHIHTRTRMH